MNRDIAKYDINYMVSNEVLLNLYNILPVPDPDLKYDRRIVYKNLNAKLK